jgi:hypothetical protein
MKWFNEWSNPANKWVSLDILIVGWWREEGGGRKDKFIDNKS